MADNLCDCNLLDEEIVENLLHGLMTADDQGTLTKKQANDARIRIQLLAETCGLPAYDSKRLKALKSLAEPKILEIHDDGDLTVESVGKTYIITTEGRMFVEG